MRRLVLATAIALWLAVGVPGHSAAQSDVDPYPLECVLDPAESPPPAADGHLIVGAFVKAADNDRSTHVLFCRVKAAGE